MTNDLEKTGLQAVIEGLGEFERGAQLIQNAYQNISLGADQVAAATGSTADATTNMIESIYSALAQQYGPGVVDTLRQMEQEWYDNGLAAEDWAKKLIQEAGKVIGPINETASAMDKMFYLMSLGAVRQIAGSLGQVGDRLIGLSKDVVMTAARIEELDLVLGNMAEQNELSADALREQVEAIRAQGIQADVAYSLVTQFVQSNLDLTKASELARLAQDAAVISMEDSSQALSGILHGILTLQPEVLRYRGIIVDLQGAYSRWSEETGRSVQSMTGAEKQTVALSAVLEQGKTITGTYESAMESASKQLRSMPRYIADLKAEMGESLLPVYSDMVFATKDLLKWMEKLPAEVKATIAVTGTLAGGLAKGTSAVISFGTQIATLVLTMRELGVAAKLTSLSFLGPVGVIAALGLAAVAVYTYVDAQEKARQQEAASILGASETYDDYVRALNDAELGSYALSESLYEIGRAGAEAANGVDLLTLSVANNELQEALRRIFMQEGPRGAGIGLNRLPNADIERVIDALKDYVGELSDAALIVAQDEEQMRTYYERMGFGREKAEELAEATRQLADAEADLRQMTEWANNAVDDWVYRIQEATSIFQDWQDEIDKTRDALEAATIGQYELAQGMYQMMQAALAADPAVEALKNQILKLIESEGGAGAAIQWSLGQMVSLYQETEDEITKLKERAESDRERAQERHDAQIEQLDEAHEKRVAAIREGAAEVNQDLLDDLAKAEEEYQQARLDLEEQYADEIAKSEQELANDRADAQQDLLDDLAEMERQYAQDIEDAQRALGRDLEDLERSLLENIADAQRDYYSDMEDLAEEHGEKVAAIEEKYAKERQAIIDKYSLEPEEPTFDEQREALFARLKDLRERYAGTGVDPIAQEQQIMRQLEELKDAELAALDERKNAELAELEEWLQEEQDVRNQAYVEQLEEQVRAYEERREERLRQYDRRLEDMQLALQRNQEERQRNYQEQLADLERQHADELERIRQNNADRLASLDERLADEQTRLRESAQQRRDQLAEQLQNERDSYSERKQALDEALADEKATIATELRDQTATVLDEANKQKEAMIAAWSQIDEGVARALDTVLDNTITPKMTAIGWEIARQVQNWMDMLAALGFVGHSPAPWWTKMAESWAQGLEAGFPAKDIFSNYAAAIQEFEGAAGRAAQPAQASYFQNPSTTTITNSPTWKVDIAAHYANGQSEASLRDDLIGLEMALRNRPGRY